MKYPPSVRVGSALDHEQHRYSLEFYGENEGAGAITKSPPSGPPFDRMGHAPEVHRVPASTPREALDKLTAALPSLGLTLDSVLLRD